MGTPHTLKCVVVVGSVLGVFAYMLHSNKRKKDQPVTAAAVLSSDLPGLTKAVLSSDLPGLTKIYSGKVRDIYAVDEKSTLHVATDRLSSFDVVMVNGIPGKGKILTQLALWWFEFLDKNGGCPNHIITGNVDEMPEKIRVHAEAIRGRCMLVKNLKMLAVESIVRGYITGSGWNEYAERGTVCEIPLPTGLKDCQKLPTNLYTPSTKAELGTHDENISFARSEEIVGKARAKELSELSLKFYKIGADYAATKGIILADTKFEFGLDSSGRLVLADEILTPDCSRFWSMDKYVVGQQQDSLDKQVVRNYLLSVDFDKSTPVVIPDHIVEQCRNKYIEIFKILTGKAPQL